MTNLAASEIRLLFEMFGKFSLLLLSKQWSFAWIEERQQLVATALLIFGVPMTDGRFVDEQGLVDIRNRPTGAEKDDRFDAVCLLAITLVAV